MVAQIQRDRPGSPIRIKLLNEDGTSRSELTVDQCEVMVFDVEHDEHPVSLAVLRRAYYAAREMGAAVEKFADLSAFLVGKR